jgi:hypothetical protein
VHREVAPWDGEGEGEAAANRGCMFPAQEEAASLPYPTVTFIGNSVNIFMNVIS